MKVLVEVDDAGPDGPAVEEAVARIWPAGTFIELFAVVHSSTPMLPDPAFVLAAVHHVQEDRQRAEAPARLDAAAVRLRSGVPGVTVTTRVLEGVPGDAIVAEAQAWGADLIIIGSHGNGPVRRAVLGSVARAVVMAAPCSVELVRPKHEVAAAAPVA
jgi:nucleotide-binding universal stress UspA family protein